MGVRRSKAGDSVTQAMTTTAGGIGAANIPQTAMVAEGYVRTASVTFFRDGATTPTATKGMQADPGDIILLNSRDEIEKFSGRTVAATGDIDWDFFTDLSG